MNGKAQQGLMRTYMLLAMLVLAPFTTPLSEAQQPDIVQEHWYHSYLTLTHDVQSWAVAHPEIVVLTIAGQTELGRNLWMLQISDWSETTKPNGTQKEVVYIDGGHHGNEHLGTELAFLTAEFYIEGWAAGDQEVIDVLTTTELHILIMLNADGNDLDTRWNINQVDLNRNYDHYWNTCPTTQPGSSAFSESETLANSNYMKTIVPDADLYVTMHTGVWIMLYPWGKWAEQPSDWELFHFIRDDVHENVSDIPIQNANQGLYPNCGTSRDFGYGVMGFPTFTFETDDEQWLPGTTEPLSSRLGEELGVMRYLITNTWHWRARLHIHDLVIEDESISATVVNNARASTSNATLWWVPKGVNVNNLNVTNELIDEFNRSFTLSSEEAVMIGGFFAVNATNSTKISFKVPEGVSDDGTFLLVYQKRVIDSSMVVVELVHEDEISFTEQVDDEYWLGGWAMFDPFSMIITMLAAAWWLGRPNA